MIKRILCYVGPWSLEHYGSIAKELSPHANVSIVSGHPKCDQVGFFNRYLQILEQGKRIEEESTTQQDVDIILRCRLLRILPRVIAIRHLTAARLAFCEVLDEQKPNLILSETIDSFVMDALYAEANKRGIPFIGLVPTFISGYFRVSARGEFVRSREVSDVETQEVLVRLLTKSYKPDFIKASDHKLIFYATGRWLRNIVKVPYFFAKRLHPLERFNYHNWATLHVSMQFMHAIPALFVGNPRWRGFVGQSGKPIIYVPLQMFPEATIDYWCEDLEAINYHSYLLKLLRHLCQDFTILIKEHPNVLGYRNPLLYKKLIKLQSVFIAPTESNSNDLIELADAVLVWTGSVGFEAAIRGKPVLTTCRSYYQIGPLFRHVDLKTSAEDIIDFTKAAKNVDLDATRKLMISHILSGMLPGTYITDGSWNSNKPVHLSYAANIGQQLRTHLSFNGLFLESSSSIPSL
jgi:hypothetical protein